MYNFKCIAVIFSCVFVVTQFKVPKVLLEVVFGNLYLACTICLEHSWVSVKLGVKLVVP